jgi:hypothetical protein
MTEVDETATDETEAEETTTETAADEATAEEAAEDVTMSLMGSVVEVEEAAAEVLLATTEVAADDVVAEPEDLFMSVDKYQGETLGGGLPRTQEGMA